VKRTRILSESVTRYFIEFMVGLTPVARLNFGKKSLILRTHSRNSSFEFRFTVFFRLGCGVDSWLPPLSFFQTAKGKAPKEALSGRLSGGGVIVTFLRLDEPQRTATRCVSLNQIDASYVICIRFFVVLCPHYSTLSSPLPFRCDKISWRGRVFQSFVWIGFYQKAVSGVVKSWEFEGILRCSKILRIRRENSIKRVLSKSRD